MSDEQERELDLALKRTGITLPPGRRRGVLATYRDLQAMLRCCAVQAPRPRSLPAPS